MEFSNATGEQKSIFEDDSLYKEGLKWHNEAYKRGLVDSDSVSTSRVRFLNIWRKKADMMK